MPKINSVPSKSQDQSGKRSESLPCLNSNKCTEELQNSLHLLSPYHRKQSLIWKENAEKFIENVGKNNVGFLTLTFVDNVKDNKEASKRFKSLRTNLFYLFGSWMLVKERQKRGAWHYHLLVDCRTDIRTGFDWDKYTESLELRKQRKPYRTLEREAFRSASSPLKNLWTELRTNLEKYNFGRSELLPIRTTAEGTAKYIGKYVSKHVGARTEEDKGVRLFTASQGQILSTTKFSWNTPGAKEWRRKLKRFTTELMGLDSTDDLKDQYGPKWAYLWTDYIVAIDEILEDHMNKLLTREYIQKRRSEEWVQNTDLVKDELCPF